MMKVDYNFSFNIKRVIDIISKNLTNFVKNDFKFMLIPFFSLFLIFNAFVSLIVARISHPIISPYTSLVILFIGFILFLYSMYIIQWLSATKSYHTLQEYLDAKNTYSSSLENTKNYKLRPFLGSLVSAVIIFLVVFTIYFPFIFQLLSVSRLGIINPLSFIFIFFLTEVLLFLLIAFVLIPLQIYPSLLLIENNISYMGGLKRSFQLLSGWKTKIKFFILYYILNYITSLALEVLFFGVLAGTILLIFLIYSFLKGAMFWFVAIELCIVILSFYIVFMIEISTSMSGTFYGQTYVNLAYPELMPSQKSRISTFPVSQHAKYCVNCGEALDRDNVYCSNCGALVKYK